MNYYAEIISRLEGSREQVNRAVDIAHKHARRGIDDRQIRRLAELSDRINDEVRKFKEDEKNSI
jgi:hypothetical protein